MTTKLFQKAADKLAQAEAEFSKEMREICHIGAQIQWERNGGIHQGRVTDHAFGKRIRVLNSATGRTYWIHVMDVISD